MSATHRRAVAFGFAALVGAVAGLPGDADDGPFFRCPCVVRGAGETLVARFAIRNHGREPTGSLRLVVQAVPTPGEAIEIGRAEFAQGGGAGQHA